MQLSSIKTTPPKRGSRRVAVVHKDYGVSSIKTPSEETLKEKEKKDKESALRAVSLDSISKNFEEGRNLMRTPDEARKQKELSEYRNKMAKSHLYSDDELISFKDKSIEQLREIDNARFLEKNPHLAAPNENHRAARS
jgi:hypothetical protein